MLLYLHLDMLFVPTPERNRSPKQVAGTLPQLFHHTYPTTFAIIDGSEIFIETPNDLHIQFLHGAVINIITLLSSL